MSDTPEEKPTPTADVAAAPEVKQPTTEEIAAKAKADAAKKLAARVAELKTYEGKTFNRKADGALVKVMAYNGIKTKDGVSAHVFLVEGPEGRWNPRANQFLADHEIVEVPEAKPSNEIL